MELNPTIQQAHHLTRLLIEALEANDQKLWDDLLERRGEAMADFNRAHQDTATPERKRCQEGILALAEADRQLQERSQQLLATVTGEFKGQLGNSAQAKISMINKNKQACLDRKA